MTAGIALAAAILAAPAPDEAVPWTGRTLEEWYGYEGFQWLLLGNAKLSLVPRNERWDEGDARGRLVILMDDPTLIARRIPDREAFGRRLDRFVRAGGRLLVACDLPAANPILAPFGVRIEPAWRSRIGAAAEAAESAARPPAVFRNQSDCPLVSDLSAHPITAGAGRLATNRPGMLASETLPVLARFPDGTRIPAALQDAPPARRGLVAAGDWGRGRVAVVSDHSLFINLMIAEEGNGRFAENLLAWLRPPGPNPRALYYQRSVPQPPRPPPRVPAFLIAPQDLGDWDRVNQVLSDPALGAGLNDLLRQSVQPGEIRRIPDIARWIAAGLALAVLLAILRALRRPPPFPRRLLSREAPPVP